MYVMYFTLCAIIISYISVVTIGFCFLFRIKFGLGFTQVLIYTGRENSFDKSKKGGVLLNLLIFFVPQFRVFIEKEKLFL